MNVQRLVLLVAHAMGALGAPCVADVVVTKWMTRAWVTGIPPVGDPTAYHNEQDSTNEPLASLSANGDWTFYNADGTVNWHEAGSASAASTVTIGDGGFISEASGSHDIHIETGPAFQGTSVGIVAAAPEAAGQLELWFSVRDTPAHYSVAGTAGTNAACVLYPATPDAHWLFAFPGALAIATSPPPYEFEGEGILPVGDYYYRADNGTAYGLTSYTYDLHASGEFGPISFSVHPVPEASTCGAAGIVIAGLLRRRRRY